MIERPFSPLDVIDKSNLDKLTATKIRINDLMVNKKYLELLGLSEKLPVTEEEITRKWKYYCRIVHPDKNLDPESQSILSEISAILNSAKDRAIENLNRRQEESKKRVHPMSQSKMEELIKQHTQPRQTSARPTQPTESLRTQQSQPAMNRQASEVTGNKKVKREPNTQNISSPMSFYGIQSPSSLWNDLNKLSAEDLLEISSKHLWDNRIAELYSEKNGDYERIIDFLIQNAGYNVNIPDSDGNYLLHHATKASNKLENNKNENNLVLLKVLLNKYGADPNIQNADGKIPLHIAFENYTIKNSAGNLLIMYGSEYQKLQLRDKKNHETPFEMLQRLNKGNNNFNRISDELYRLYYIAHSGSGNKPQ